jgi:DHA2 family multidrug resistance protein
MGIMIIAMTPVVLLLRQPKKTAAAGLVAGH